GSSRPRTAVRDEPSADPRLRARDSAVRNRGSAAVRLARIRGAAVTSHGRPAYAEPALADASRTGAGAPGAVPIRLWPVVRFRIRATGRPEKARRRGIIPAHRRST